MGSIDNAANQGFLTCKNGAQFAEFPRAEAVFQRVGGHGGFAFRGFRPGGVFPWLPAPDGLGLFAALFRGPVPGDYSCLFIVCSSPGGGRGPGRGRAGSMEELRPMAFI